MFQNISENLNNQDISDDIQENRINLILKELFKPHNCIIYILTFLVSMVEIKNEILPFGLAILAACIGSTVPVFMVYIISIVSTAIFHGGSGLASYFYTSLIFFLLNFMFKPKISLDNRNEVFKVGSRLFIASFLYNLIKNIRGVFLIYDLFLGIVIAALTYTFYKIFVNGIVVIRDIKEKQAFTVEEVIAMSIILAIAISVFKNITIFELSISHILIIFMIMWLGWKNGMIVGGTAGLSIGLALTLVGNFNILELTVFAVSGILAGIFNRFGKLGVILGFVLGNTILTYLANGNTATIIYFREIFIASIGLLFVPSKFKIKIEDLFEKEKLLTNIGEHRLNYYEDMHDKLNAVVDTISDINNKSVDLASTTLNKDSYIENFLNLMDNYQENIFYEDVINNEDIIADIYEYLNKEDIITENNITEIFRKYNNYILMRDSKIKNDLQELIKVANRTYRELQINEIKIQTRKEESEKLRNELNNVTNIINKVSNETKDNVKFENKEKEIFVILKGKGYEVNNVEIKKLKNGKCFVEIGYLNKDEKIKEKAKINSIADIVSKVIGSKFLFQRDKNNLSTNIYSQEFSEEDKFSLHVGSSRLSKDGNSISGDSNLQVKLNDGKYLLAISDGMGSGPKAKEKSKFVINHLNNLLTKGFEQEDVLSLINSDLLFKKDDDIYATVDMTILDLFKGEMSIIKNGACNTYIKNKKGIKVIRSKQMPVGIINDIEIVEDKYELNEDDIILMCSDGLFEAKEELRKDWVEEFLKKVTINNPQKIADLIVSEAVDNSFGMVKDDITVIVTKISKK